MLSEYIHDPSLPRTWLAPLRVPELLGLAGSPGLQLRKLLYAHRHDFTMPALHTRSANLRTTLQFLRQRTTAHIPYLDRVSSAGILLCTYAVLSGLHARRYATGRLSLRRTCDIHEGECGDRSLQDGRLPGFHVPSGPDRHEEPDDKQLAGRRAKEACPLPANPRSVRSVRAAALVQTFKPRNRAGGPRPSCRPRCRPRAPPDGAPLSPSVRLACARRAGAQGHRALSGNRRRGDFCYPLPSRLAPARARWGRTHSAFCTPHSRARARAPVWPPGGPSVVPSFLVRWASSLIERRLG